jgi:hypothetical protein
MFHHITHCKSFQGSGGDGRIPKAFGVVLDYSLCQAKEKAKSLQILTGNRCF